jgi:hypothetical protein
MIFSPHSFPTTIESSHSVPDVMTPCVAGAEPNHEIRPFLLRLILTHRYSLLRLVMFVAVAFLFTYILSLPHTCSKLVMLM